MELQNKGKHLLIVGGAGYIGSHTAHFLTKNGYMVTIFDNLSTGSLNNVKDFAFLNGDLSNSKALDEVFSGNKFDGVFHFAALKSVEESIKDPLYYYQKNLCPTLNLLEAMQKHQVKNFVFSSSAAIYGLPQSDLISEDHPTKPINPYGKSKLFLEEILKDLVDKGLRYCSLRYFNAAGTNPHHGMALGETEKNVIPVLFKCVIKNIPFQLFGHDYVTPDGTCIRDYVHVNDLARAHLLAFEHLKEDHPANVYNLGTGKGYSVLEVIEAVEIVTGKKIEVVECPRRAGDPPILVADGSKANRELGWNPEFTQLETTISHMWNSINHLLNTNS